MTTGVGTNNQEDALAKLSDMTGGLAPIEEAEFRARLEKAAQLMREKDWQALLVTAGSGMLYFTGTHWHSSERLVAALIFPDASIVYISPEFEVSTITDFMGLKSPVRSWEEHECPYSLVSKILSEKNITSGKLGMDEAAPFFVSNGIAKAAPNLEMVDGAEITARCRMIKSPAEIAIIQRVMDMTIEVHKATASILTAGISTTEVVSFIDKAHRKVGAVKGNFFAIVLFGEATAYPHGVKDPQILKDGDMVLVDSGCSVHDYISDITRTYVYGTPTERQRQVWGDERAAQQAAFDAVSEGAAIAAVDAAARGELESRGYGPGYRVPGLPHRTGHGIGLDIHEWPYLVGNNDTKLEAGMCLSIEPMLCIYGEFGVRLEDHFHIGESGPKWFTQPCKCIDDPFGLNAD
ncbi:MAG: Xaa-Pro peptidase family protein [Akkermansiaceae bacterium]|nr:Xaa-Pro peptidase family protein [Akkermansiaceae bacterium]